MPSFHPRSHIGFLFMLTLMISGVTINIFSQSTSGWLHRSNVSAQRYKTVHLKNIGVSYETPKEFQVLTRIKSPRVLVRQTLKITNSSSTTFSATVPVTVGDFSVSGCTTLPKAGCEITVIYNYAAATTSLSEAVLQVVLNDGAGATYPLDITLEGTTDTPPISYSPLGDFSATLTVPQTKTLKIFNTGQTPYVVGTPTTTGLAKANFVATNCQPARIDAQNTECDITIKYTPTTAGNSDVAIISITLTDDSGATKPLSITLNGSAASSCQQTLDAKESASKRFLPLWGREEATINCYYATAGNLATATSIQYQYNPVGNANNVSVDLLSAQFMEGFQLTLAASASANSCSSATSATSTATSSSCSGSSSSTPSSPSLAQLVQSVEQGGNFGLKSHFPLLDAGLAGGRGKASIFASPSVGFTVTGLSATNTTSSATNVNGNLAGEAYAQLDAISASAGAASPMSIYVDYRFGEDILTQDYASSLSLQSNKFFLQQFTAGLLIEGAVRISGTRYYGPSQGFGNSTGTAPTNNFAGWQLHVQLTPAALLGAGSK